MKEPTTALIERLGTGLVPAPSRLLDRQLMVAVSTGGAAALLLLAFSRGLRPDLLDAAGEWILWGKILYAASLAGGGYLLCRQAAGPAAPPPWRLAAILVPGALALGARSIEWLGQSAALCPWLIALLALPCLLALCYVMRRAAPTRLRWGGFCAGLLAGAISMLVYALHCPETGMAFVATWYTLGMCVPAAIGALVGPRLLRW